MSRFVFSEPPVVSLAVRDVAGTGNSSRFPVRRVYCVGRNYAEHAVEMGHDPGHEEPFFFTKPRDAVRASGGRFTFPTMTEVLHPEVELVVAIGRDGADIDVEHALDHVYGYAVGLDMTRRDLQQRAKSEGRPWDMGKAFDDSAPMSEVVPASEIGHPVSAAITLEVNDGVAQAADISQLIWSVPHIIAILSRYVRLGAGDLIMTGTPAGVAAIRAGDTLRGTIEGIGTVEARYG